MMTGAERDCFFLFKMKTVCISIMVALAKGDYAKKP